MLASGKDHADADQWDSRWGEVDATGKVITPPLPVIPIGRVRTKQVARVDRIDQQQSPRCRADGGDGTI